MHNKFLLTLLLLVSSSALFAQENDTIKKDEKDKKWDVSDPYTADWNIKEVELNTDEGTWMNLDVSPDGKTIVFDLLGDIYKMPISGGKATALTSGMAYTVQPRFSPDGSKISFTSDAGGGDNIWIMNADGSNAKQLTKENFRLLNNAVWTPDGNAVVARKHFTSGRSLGAGEMWMYHIGAGEAGIQLTERKNDQQDVNEPSISPDGRYLYYSEDMYPGGAFQYNKDPNNQIYVINRYDFETGEIDRVTGGPGGAARPQVSPDGKKLAFVKRVRTNSVLYIHNLETGEEWPVYKDLSKDQQEAWAIFGVYPGFSWPNNNEIVVWSEGKIKKINTESTQVADVPFQVNNTIKIADTHSADSQVYTENFNPKVIRHAITSPDGKTLVFNAVGHLWKKNLPNGKPERLTKAEEFEFEPSFSPDGKSIVYVTWDDGEMGAVRSVELNGRNQKKLTSEKGIYRNPEFSRDGKMIVFSKESGNTDLGRTFTKNPGIYLMNASGENIRRIHDEGDFPMFTADNKRIFFQTGGYLFGNLTKKLNSVDLTGQDQRTHIESKYGGRLVPSPDNKWIAFSNLHKAYIAPLLMTGKPVELGPDTKTVPVRQIAKDAGINLHWSNNSQNVHWTLGDEYFTNKVSERFTFLKNSVDSIPPITENGIKVGLEVATDAPKGTIAFTNARIITMNEQEEVIENGTIVVEENKIVAIGPASEVNVPKNAKVYNVQGNTIMPGMIDAHAHIGAFRYGLTPQQHWPFFANLAYGVTTAHDPSALSETVFGMAELIKSGEMVGPRLYSTGIILYGAEGDFKAEINSLEDARSALRRTKAFGATSVKSYNQPRREQRQQVMQAAKELNMNVVPEGGSTFFHNMNMIVDGHTGIEHNIPIAPVYKDVKTLWGNSDTGYTPTLIVNYGGINGEYYFYDKTNVWENEKLLKFTPRSIIDSRSRHRTTIPEEEYEEGPILVSETAKVLSDVGVKVNMGAHGQLQGLGAHWELWLIQMGGMSNMEALKTATINPAEYLGLGEEIGSLEEGKLADLIVLEKNPLEDIKNTNTILYVMVNGRLYDASTMNEIGNHPKERGDFYWENNRYNASFDWHEEGATHSGFMAH